MNSLVRELRKRGETLAADEIERLYRLNEKLIIELQTFRSHFSAPRLDLEEWH